MVFFLWQPQEINRNIQPNVMQVHIRKENPHFSQIIGVLKIFFLMKYEGVTLSSYSNAWCLITFTQFKILHFHFFFFCSIKELSWRGGGGGGGIFFQERNNTISLKDVRQPTQRIKTQRKIAIRELFLNRQPSWSSYY